MKTFWLIPLLIVLFGAVPAGANIVVQCPGDVDGDLIPDQIIPAGFPGEGTPNLLFNPNVKCMHIVGADGFAKMADGYDQYMFSFGLVGPTDPPTIVSPDRVVTDYILKAKNPGPSIIMDEGQEMYLTLSNVGLVMRPDLFDPHSVHYHGFPNAAPIFDGLPEPSPTPNMGSSLTYYYKAAVPGTYFYHCHVEASEHMQMGMIGNAWIRPAQNGTTYMLQDGTNREYSTFAYNDGDGSTGYDVDYPIQLTGFDSYYHDAHINVQPLPFAAMYDNYHMINGRGYPDTVNVAPITNNAMAFGATSNFDAQDMFSTIVATQGHRVLLRVSNVSTTHQYAITTNLGVPMKVVGRDAALLRGPDGKDTSMDLSVLEVAGGQAFDVILDTKDVAPGFYFLYATDFAALSNGPQDRGGIMTEIIVIPDGPWVP
jgi:FtsP/CotA-like multicopper oxidase with cupredoxin domain